MKKRHETLLKAFGCLEQYKQCRLKFTKYCIGKGSKIPISKSPEYSIQPNSVTFCPLEIKSISSNSKNNIINIEYYKDEDTMRIESEMLSDEAILQEIHFNYGKTFSELKLFHLAVKHYKLALALADVNPWLLPEKYYNQNKKINCIVKNDDNNNNNNNYKNNNDNINYSDENRNEKNNSMSNNLTPHSTTQGQSHLHVTREAAHNLVLIYRKSGAKDQALEIMQKYLVF